MPPTPVVLDKGRFLFLQGQQSDAFYIMKSGAAEILINEDDPTPDENTVIAGARRIALLDRPNLPLGEIGVLEGVPRSASVRAVERCEFLRMPGSHDEFLRWVHGNLSAALLIARALANRIIENHAHLHRLRFINRRMATYIDNFTILYSIFSSRAERQSAHAALIQKGRDLIAQLDPKTTPQLSNVDRNLPVETTTPDRTQPFAEVELGFFFHTLLSQPDQTLGWLISAQEKSPLTFITGQLSEMLPKLSHHVHMEMTNLESTVRGFFGPAGLIQAFVGLHVSAEPEQREAILPYLHKLLSIARDLRGSVVKIWGETFPMSADLEQSIGFLEKGISGQIVPAPVERSVAPPVAQVAQAAPPLPVAEPKGLNLRSVLTSGALSESEREQLEIIMGIRQAQPNAIYQSYWSLYPTLWKMARTQDTAALIALLRYGIASPEPYAPPEHLNLDRDASGPILYIDQWLERIYRGESQPSRTDLGQTYQDVLREAKTTQFVPDEPDPKMDLVRFEVAQMAAKAARAFSGGRGEIAILRRTPDEIKGLIDKMNSAARVAEALVKVIRLDFTAFVRDVRVTLSERSEFLPAEVLPFVIILPATGERGIAWQEFEGRAKDTPGRLLIPLFGEGDIGEIMIQTVAKFRWDLNKTIAGADWMNPAEGGLTGRYFDYASFYKKNPELSDEQKERLDQMYSTLALDGDKFAAEYMLWMKYESQAVQKLNKVARRIFAEFCPFSLETRKKLIAHPAYSEILRKDSNKRLKKREEIERRIQKLEKSGVEVGNTFATALRMYEPIPE